MKLAVIFTPFPPPFGGIANWSNLVREVLRSSEHEVTFVDTTIRSRDRFRRGSFFAASLSYLYAVSRILSSFPLLKKHEAIHCCTSWGRGALKDLLILLLARFARRPVFFHYHFGQLPKILSGNNLSRSLLTYIIRRSAGSIVLDSASKNAILGSVPKARVFLIPNGVILPNHPKQRDKAKVFTFAGWVKKEKGVEDLLHAWQKANLDGWQLSIAGPIDPDYRAHLKTNFDLGGVTLLGELPQQELFELLENSVALVLPSYSEGFPFVVLEALVRGCFVISTDVGALPDMLAPGLGLQIKPGDVPSLVKYLREIACNPQFATLGAKGPSYVAENFSIERVTADYVAAWTSIRNIASRN